jgi:superfamily II DNA helicase RecQ
MEYDCGIVYCRTRAQTEELTARLFTKGVPALAYHGGNADNSRLDFPCSNIFSYQVSKTRRESALRMIG